MLEYNVVSHCDREDLYVELMFNRKQWGEIVLRDDRKSVDIIICPDVENKSLAFSYDKFLNLIAEAKCKLLKVEGIDE